MAARFFLPLGPGGRQRPLFLLQAPDLALTHQAESWLDPTPALRGVGLKAEVQLIPASENSEDKC